MGWSRKFRDITFRNIICKHNIGTAVLVISECKLLTKEWKILTNMTSRDKGVLCGSKNYQIHKT